MRLLLVAGARPNFMKLASLVDALERDPLRSTGEVDFRLLHTGQHYDERMSAVFFTQLGLPRPDYDLKVGSSSHAEQTADVMKRFEPVLLDYRPDVVVVVGDVNSTIACALVASKINYPARTRYGSTSTRARPLIAHVEAGLRSFDRSMPEEVNRVLTDAISDFLFVTERAAIENLRREGHPNDRIFFVGNTMVDTLLKHRETAESSQILSRLNLRSTPDQTVRSYAVLTLHRPSNVDLSGVFQDILEAVLEGVDTLPIVFPLHPRTAGRIEEFGLGRYFAPAPVSTTCGKTEARVITLEALPYLDFLCLMANASLMLTDSGGIQEETTALSVPCITIRDTTERPVTVEQGTNTLVGTDRTDIANGIRSSLRRPPGGRRPELWDGCAGRRIVEILKGELLA